MVFVSCEYLHFYLTLPYFVRDFLYAQIDLNFIDNIMIKGLHMVIYNLIHYVFLILK